MAINLITQPGATTPIGNDDYTQQNLLINGAMAQGDEVLTDWADTVTEPSIAQGTYFYHSGNLYQVDSADEAISGTIASGVNYIVLSVSGTTLTASYTTDISSYTFNPAYNGLYNGTDLVIKAVTYLIGTANIRGTSINKTMDGMFMLSDGSLVTSAGQFNIGDKDIVTTGNIDIDGAVIAQNGVLTTNLTTTGGDPVFDSVTSGSSALKWKTFSGSLDGSGNATITTGITGINIYSVAGSIVISTGAYPHIVLSDTLIDINASTVTLDTAYNSGTYRVVIFYI